MRIKSFTMQREAILLGLIAAVLITSGCVESEPETPDETLETYFDDLTGFSVDTESAYELLSSEAQSEVDYPDFHQEVTSLESATNANYELLTVETLDESEETATVEIIYSIEPLQGGSINQEREIELVTEDENWRVNENFNPYDGSE